MNSKLLDHQMHSIDQYYIAYRWNVKPILLCAELSNLYVCSNDIMGTFLPLIKISCEKCSNATVSWNLLNVLVLDLTVNRSFIPNQTRLKFGKNRNAFALLQQTSKSTGKHRSLITWFLELCLL